MALDGERVPQGDELLDPGLGRHRLAALDDGHGHELVADEGAGDVEGVEPGAGRGRGELGQADADEGGSVGAELVGDVDQVGRGAGAQEEEGQVVPAVDGELAEPGRDVALGLGHVVIADGVLEADDG